MLTFSNLFSIPMRRFVSPAYADDQGIARGGQQGGAVGRSAWRGKWRGQHDNHHNSHGHRKGNKKCRLPDADTPLPSAR